MWWDFQIKQGLLLSLPVKTNLKSMNIGIVTGKKVDCVLHFLLLLAVWWPGAQVHETTTFLPVTLPNIHRKKISLADSARNLSKIGY